MDEVPQAAAARRGAAPDLRQQRLGEGLARRPAHTLIEGALLTVAIVFLFLHSWRSTIITGLTLPIAVISSFIAVYAFGFTLNFMTMMALSLCIGLLIDDAIVVRENIVRHVAWARTTTPRRARAPRRSAWR
jgi:multidrug efflux pump subunit AcrB